MTGRPGTGPAPAPAPAEDLVRSGERSRLARELYDIVAHHLSNVALRTMGPLDVTDLARLQRVLSDVNRATSAALLELRLLAHVLEHDRGGTGPPDALRELGRQRMPTAAAEDWRHRLTAAGRAASSTVPAAADLLPLSVQATVVRTFDATGAAVLAHTAPDARCSTAVSIGSDELVVSCRAALTGTVNDREEGLGRELCSLRERVELTRGLLRAGVDTVAPGQRAWVVTVVLPLC